MIQTDPELLSAIKEVVIEVAKTQSSVGEGSINGAAYIIVSITMFLIFFGIVFYMIKTMTKVQNQQNEQQKAMFSKILDNNNNTQILETFSSIKVVMEETVKYLRKVSVDLDEEAKVECNSAQAHIIFKVSLKAASFEIFKKIVSLINNNHIEEQDRIKKRVQNIIENEYEEVINSLMGFKYRGNRLSAFLVRDFVDSSIETVIQYIYSSEDFNKKRGILYDQFEALNHTTYNKFKSKIDVVRNNS